MVVSPGKKLRLVIEELGLDQIKVADTIGVTRQTINNIVNDRQAISREMANKLARLTGRTPGYWLQSEFQDRDGFEDAPGAPASGAAVLVDHQIVQAVDDGIIGVTPFDPGQIQAASIDLRLGDLIIPAGGEPVNIGHGRTFSLAPGQTVNVQTLEFLRFPDDHIGRLGAMTQIARFGIIVAHGFQIDPNYQGHLQFCLFNASSIRHELVSGASIISLEITRLAARPSGGRIALESGRDDVRMIFDPARACVRLVRNWLAPHVETKRADGRVVAKIPELNIELTADSEEAAIDSAVTTALVRFRSACANQKLAPMRTAFAAFFTQRARRLYLDNEAMRNAAQVLGLALEDDVIMLESGAYLPLPAGTAEIAFEVFAEQLGSPAAELILALTRSVKGGDDGTVTQLRSGARKTTIF